MNKVTQEQINDIMEETRFIIDEKESKLTIVTAVLPNGFTIVESSGCVDPINYDRELGIELCKKKIKDKIWYLEGYRLQQRLYEREKRK
ncbi:hypothetical protein Goe4_c00210 [Bacillus phage vB_BthP-Goe4]|uniref:Phage protein (N4 Gp49/phage Sf6 gene 66) family protein n=1 Tax=Bacillus phage vB_BthP-Goe4 TaxID=2315470 RepID=A0A386KR68_9CAUD|nr:hypothetical protein H3015_gp23 [Bacillus phage vB_BthP-Goe4]AYD87730.1 hypothetical protein Goe4_c00210 [Bacillus phage vB_BthP-Goe4]AZV00065.1 hypothetical protein [Bacillus phage vB_BthP-HD73phi]